MKIVVALARMLTAPECLYHLLDDNDNGGRHASHSPASSDGSNYAHPVRRYEIILLFLLT